MKTKKVLICINSIRRGGMEISAATYQQNLDCSAFEFTYYVRESKNTDISLLNAILSSNAKVVYKPPEVKNKIQEYRWIKRYLSTNKFDIVHSHMQFHSGIVLKAAYKSGVRKRIAHSHFTKDNRKIGVVGEVYRKIMRMWLNRYATKKLACCVDAGRFLYGNSFERTGTVINNGINFSQYMIDKKAINEFKTEMGLDNKFVVGHVGSIYWIKNQLFLIKIFHAICQKKKNAFMILCGEICDNGECQELVKKLNLCDKVMFLGVRSDIPKLLAAMDVLVFPSLFEAMPIVPIEAQATRLPTLLSDRISHEIKKNNNVEYLSLDQLPEVWAQKAIELANCDRESVNIDKLRNDYDIRNIAKQLEQIYLGD